MSKRPLLVVGGAVAFLAAAVAIRRLLEIDDIREKIGLPPLNPRGDRGVDTASEDSFPASDPPSFTATTAAR